MSVRDRETAPVGSIISVNVGRPRDVEWAGRTVRTAIWKEPTDAQISIRHHNLDGDQQADLRVHGGPDKAVYAYASEDYSWWEHELRTTLGAGTFGENLTTAGLDLRSSVIGEVWGVGSAVLEVAQTRQPCFKLGIRMGDARFVQEFERARRFGVYLRIKEVGEVTKGDSISVLSRPSHGLTAEMFANTLDSRDPLAIRRLVEVTDVPESTRRWAERQIDRIDRNET